MKPDLSPGMCSYEGSVFITDVNGDGVLRMFTVKYDKSGSIGGKTEAGIPYSRLIRIPSPFGSPKLCENVVERPLRRSSRASKRYLLPAPHVVNIRIGEPKN